MSKYDESKSPFCIYLISLFTGVFKKLKLHLYKKRCFLELKVVKKENNKFGRAFTIFLIDLVPGVDQDFLRC